MMGILVSPVSPAPAPAPAPAKTQVSTPALVLAQQASPFRKHQQRSKMMRKLRIANKIVTMQMMKKKKKKKMMMMRPKILSLLAGLFL
jgi:hypothetical protein